MSQHHPHRSRWIWSALCPGLLLPALATPTAHAQAHAAAPSATTAADAVPSKAARYHTVLRRSPQPGLVFERFCDAWLAESSAESLEAFLANQAAAGDPADALIHGFYLARAGRNADALRVFRDTLQAHPGSAAAHFFKAKTEAATLDFDTALTDLEAAAQAQPDDALAADIAELRGRLLARVGRRDEAIKVWGDLLEQHPDDPEQYENLVAIQTEEGLFDQAVNTLDQLIKRTTDPQRKVGRALWRGDVLQQSGRKAEALAAYEAALESVGSGGWLERQVLGQIEQVYRRDEDMPAFAQRLDELAQQHPERIELSRRRARVLGELGQTDQAITQWRAVLERAPGDRALRAAFADVLADAGRHEDAVALTETLLNDRPDDTELRLSLAGLYQKLKRPDDAEREVRRFIDAAQGETSASVRGIRTLERLELDDAAEAVAREWVARQAQGPDAARASEALAELLFRLDAPEKKDEAVAMWRAMGADATDATGVIDAARALSARGKTEAALGVLVGRVEAFSEDSELLAALADASLRGGKPEAAVPWLRPWLGRVESTEALGRAVATAARVARSAKTGETLAAELTAVAPAQRTDGEVWLLAQLHEQVGDSPAADAVLDAADGTREPIIRARVGLLTQRGQYADAADALQTLVEQPGNARSDLLRELIDLYARDLRIDTALLWIERWKQASPGSVSPWLRQSELLLSEGREPAALQALQTAARRFSEDVSVNLALADLYAGRGRTADAARVYWSLIEQADSTAARLPYVAKLAQLTRFTDGAHGVITRLEQRRDQDRDNVENYLALAEVYRVIDRYEERRAALMEAARVQPENLDLLLAIARTEEQGGDVEQAMATLRRAMPLDKGDQIRHRLARLHVQMGETERALELLNDFGDSGPDADQALAFADALAGLGEWDAAAKFLVDPIVAEPADYRLRYLRGVALSEDAQVDAAADAMLSVLDIQDELATLTTPPANPMATMASAYRDLLVPESMDLIRQMSSQWQAMSHRNNNMHRGLMPGSTTTINVPDTVTAAHDMAIVHLRALAQDADDPGRDALVAQMQDRGVRLADLLVEMSVNLRGNEMLPPDALETYGDDPAVMGLALLMSGFGQQPMEAESLARGETLFAESRPALSLMAGLAHHAQAVAAGDDAYDEDGAAWPRLEAKIKALGKPPEMLVMMLARYAGPTAWGMGQATELPEAQRDVLAAQMRDWYTQLDATSQMRPMLFASIVSGTVEAEDWPALARLMIDEVDRHRDAKNPAASAGPMAMMMAMNRQQGTAIQELTFPPPLLASVPSTVSMMLSPNGMNMFRQGEPIDPAALLKQLPEDTPPLMRALVAGAADDNDQLHAALNPLLSGESPSLDAFLTAAAWESHAGRPAAAATYLTKASYLPMSRAEREAIDGATVAAALAIDGELADDTRTAAQRAALRMRRSASAGQDQSAIVDALTRLGLNKEAERLEQQIATAPAPASSSIRHPGGITALTGTDKIETLLGEDRRDDAIRLAAREVGKLGQNMAQSPWVLQQQGATELLSLIERRGLKDEVIAAADPGESARGQRQMKFALALEALGDTDRAADTYRRMNADRPDAAATARLFLLEIGRDDSAAAAAVLANLPERQLQQLPQVLMNTLQNNHNQDPLRAVHAADAVALWVNGSDDPAALQLGWVSSIWWTLTQRTYFQNQQLPHVYDTTVWAKLNAADKTADKNADAPDLGFDVERQRKRIAAHDRLAKSLLANAATATDAAARLALTTRLRGEPLHDAIKAAAAALSMKLPRNAGFGGVHHFGGNAEPNVARLRPADELLAAWAAEHDDPAAVTQVTDELRAQRRAPQADRLDALYAVYAAAPADFPAAAEALAKLARRSPQDAPGLTAALVDAAADLPPGDTTLEPILFEQIKKSQGFHGQQALTAIVPYADQVAARDGRDAAAAFLERFATEYIGPADEREAIIEKHYDPNSWHQQSINGKLHGFTQMLQGAAKTPSLTWAALDHLSPFARSTKAKGQINYSYLVRQTLEPVEDRDRPAADRSADLIALLDGSPLIADAQNFRSFAYESRHGNDPGSVVASLRQFSKAVFAEGEPQHTPVLEAATAWLDDQPDTLGKVVTGAALRGDPAEATLNALAPYQSDIAAMSDVAKSDLVGALPPLDRLKDLTHEAQALATLLGGVREDDLAQRAQAILDIKAFAQHSNQAYELGQTVGPIALGLYEQGDSETSFKLLEHFDTLTKKSSNSHWGAGEALRRLTFSSRSDKDFLPFVLMINDLARHASLSGTLANDNLLGNLRQPMDKVVQQAGKAVGHDTKGPARWIAGLDALADELDGHSAVGLLPALLSQARYEVQDKNLSEALSLIAERQSANPAPLWSTAEAAVRARRISTVKKVKPGDPDFEADTAFVTEHLTQLAHNDAIPTPTRLAVLRSPMALLKDKTPPGVAAVAATLLTATLNDAPHTVTRGAADTIFERALFAERKDDAWPTDPELVAAYLSAVSRRARPGQPEVLQVSVPRSRSLTSAGTARRAPTASLAVLRMSLDAGLNEEADRLLRVQDGRLATSPASWAELVAHGRHEAAAQHIRKRHADARLVSVTGFDYTPEVHENLSGLDAAFNGDHDAGLRFYAQAVLAALPDLETENDTGLPSRSARLTALAQAYDPDLLKGPELPHLTLLILAGDRAAARALSQPLEQATANVSLSDIARVRNTGQHRNPAFELLNMRLMASLEHGDPALLNAEIDALYDENNMDPNNGSYQVREQVQAAKNMIVRALRQDEPAIPAAALPGMRQILRRVMEPPAFMSRLNVSTSEVALLASLDLFDETADPQAFNTWFDERPTNKATPNLRKPSFNRLRVQLKYLLFRADVSDDRRVATVIRGLESNDQIDELDILERLTFDNKLLTVDELAAHGPALTAPLGDPGLVGLASALARGKHAQANAAWQAAIAAVSTEDADPELRLELAKRLVKFKQPDGAKTLVESWSPDHADTAKKLESFRKKHFPTPASEGTPTGTPS